MTQDIFDLLKNNPKTIFTAKEIAKKVGVNIQSAHRSLRKMKKLDCIKCYKLAKRSEGVYWYEEGKCLKH